jgi:hypothetical protein
MSKRIVSRPKLRPGISFHEILRLTNIQTFSLSLTQAGLVMLLPLSAASRSPSSLATRLALVPCFFCSTSRFLCWLASKLYQASGVMTFLDLSLASWPLRFQLLKSAGGGTIACEFRVSSKVKKRDDFTGCVYAWRRTPRLAWTHSWRDVLSLDLRCFAVELVHSGVVRCNISSGKHVLVC